MSEERLTGGLGSYTWLSLVCPVTSLLSITWQSRGCNRGYLELLNVAFWEELGAEEVLEAEGCCTEPWGGEHIAFTFMAFCLRRKKIQYNNSHKKYKRIEFLYTSKLLDGMTQERFRYLCSLYK